MNGATALTRDLQRMGVPDRLVIASGTEWSTIVSDARQLGPWSQDGGVSIERQHLIVYHHTASANTQLRRRRDQLVRLFQEVAGSPYGLPYNFVVMPVSPYRIFYLNDVDHSWPHTYGYNYATAIAAFGNFEVDEPEEGMVAQMHRLADALATMWDEYVPERQHRDVYATACPGKYLSASLKR